MKSVRDSVGCPDHLIQADKFAKKMGRAAKETCLNAHGCGRMMEDGFMWVLNSQELQWVPSVFGPKKEKLLPGYLLSRFEAGLAVF